MKVEIIGAGAAARGIHIPALRLCPEVEIALVADPAPASPVEGLPLVADYRELLARGDIAAVVNAAPNFLHREITLAAIQAGKHVLCEKPLGMNFPETVEMLQAAEAAGIVHLTGFSYRYVPA